MKTFTRAIVFGLLVVVVAAVGVAGTAKATTSSTATLTVMRSQDDFSEIGWNATWPGFADTGSWTSDFRAGGGGNSPVFAGVLKTSESGGHGSFQTNWQVLATPTSFGGTCQVSGGTGDYAGLQGSGTWTYSENATTRFYTCVLRVHWQ